MSDHNIWPGLTSADPLALRAWLARLGFTEGGCYFTDDGTTVQHSEMRWPEGGRVMISSHRRGDGHNPSAPGTSSVYVVVDDADAVYARATDLGATISRELTDSDYGSRGFSVRDPDGNGWSFGTYAGD